MNTPNSKINEKRKKQLSRHTLPDFTLHSFYIFDTILEMCAIEIDHKLFMMHMINVHQCLCSYMYVTVKLTRNVVFSSTYA